MMKVIDILLIIYYCDVQWHGQLGLICNSIIPLDMRCRWLTLIELEVKAKFILLERERSTTEK